MTRLVGCRRLLPPARHGVGRITRLHNHQQPTLTRHFLRLRRRATQAPARHSRRRVRKPATPPRIGGSRLSRRWSPLDDDARAAVGVRTAIWTMLASGLLPGAEGERLQSGVADRRLRPTSELPADSPATCTFAAHHRAGPLKGLASGEVEELVGGGSSGRCRRPSQSARCASDVGAGAAGALGEHPVPAGSLEVVDPAGAVAGRRWRRGHSRAGVSCARRSQNPVTGQVVRR